MQNCRSVIAVFGSLSTVSAVSSPGIRRASKQGADSADSAHERTTDHRTMCEGAPKAARPMGRPTVRPTGRAEEGRFRLRGRAQHPERSSEYASECASKYAAGRAASAKAHQPRGGVDVQRRVGAAGHAQHCSSADISHDVESMADGDVAHCVGAGAQADGLPRPAGCHGGVQAGEAELPGDAAVGRGGGA